MDEQLNPFFWQEHASEEKLQYTQRFVTPHKILDIGCGAGWYTAFLESLGYTVFPTDFALRMKNAAQHKFTFVEATALPFESSSFDTVLMYDVLEHIENEEAALAELHRVTRSRIILSVPSANDGFLPKYGLALLHHIDKTHVREYSPEDLSKKLDAHGFDVVDMRFSYANHMPFVIQEFFVPTLPGKLLRLLTLLWIKVLKRARMINNPIGGDIFVVADKRPHPSHSILEG